MKTEKELTEMLEELLKRHNDPNTCNEHYNVSLMRATKIELLAEILNKEVSI